MPDPDLEIMVGGGGGGGRSSRPLDKGGTRSPQRLFSPEPLPWPNNQCQQSALHTEGLLVLRLYSKATRQEILLPRHILDPYGLWAPVFAYDREVWGSGLLEPI